MWEEERGYKRAYKYQSLLDRSRLDLVAEVEIIVGIMLIIINEHDFERLWIMHRDKPNIT